MFEIKLVLTAFKKRKKNHFIQNYYQTVWFQVSNFNYLFHTWCPLTLLTSARNLLRCEQVYSMALLLFSELYSFI